MDLYTTLVRIKQELNSGAPVPMTAVPDNVRHIINPDFVEGLGGMTEDEDRGLRCPVCGEWRHSLRQHLNTAHKEQGGAEKILRALEIPQNAKLSSARFRKRTSERMRKGWAEGVYSAERSRTNLSSVTREMAIQGPSHRARKQRRATTKTTGARNLKNKCEAQVIHRILDLNNRLGRPPNSKEAGALDRGLYTAARVIFGTWDAAKAHAGLRSINGPGKGATYTKGLIVETVRAWYEEHGRLPTHADAAHPQCLPSLPVPATIIRVLQAASWPAAMRKIAVRMGIHDFRYHRAPEDEGAPHRGYRREEIVEAYRSYYARTGSLPNSKEVRPAKETGLPTAASTQVHMQAKSWNHAMYEMAHALGIYDDRYRPEAGLIAEGKTKWERYARYRPEALAS